MFNHAQNTYIAGGSFNITTNNTVNGPLPLDALYKRAAPNALLNAGGRADEVRCHPGTRREVIRRIERWRDAQDSQTPPIFWLSGPAGAGKTAIVQTIAERCKAQGAPQANFFFFRTDSSRNSLSPLIATLVHQIVLLYSALRDPVVAVLSNNPLILDSTLEDQLTQLVVAPLQTIRRSSSSDLTPLLLIDGLDECESEGKRSQRQILRAFDKVLEQNPSLFRLLVASRDESQIRAAFNNISSGLLPLYLDDQYTPEHDIRTFVIDEFERVRKTHPLAHTLHASWPPMREIDNIVGKSSGQFIYASTVLRFIMDSSASPELSLTRVQSAAQLSGNPKSPFSHLDSTYTFILSQADDQEALKDILHAQLIIAEYRLRNTPWILIALLHTYNSKYTGTVLCSSLANLTPIAQYKDNSSLIFHHASFPDYLLDQSRSSNYFVDLDAFNLKIQPALWKDGAMLGILSDPWSSMRELAIRGLIRLRQLPPGFLNTLVGLEPACFDGRSFLIQSVDILEKLYTLCSCGDDLMNYKQILRRWIKEQPLGYDLKYGYEPDDSEWPSGSRRYLAMICIDRAITMEPLGWIDVALRSETESDVRETTLWLNELLHRTHREKYDNVEEYNRLLQKWVSWATWNGIPLDCIEDLPNARWYMQRSRMEKWGARYLGFGSRPE